MIIPLFRNTAFPKTRFAKFRFSEIPLFQNTAFPKYRFSKIQLCKNYAFPKFRFFKIPLLRNIAFPKYRFCKIPLCKNSAFYVLHNFILHYPPLLFHPHGLSLFLLPPENSIFSNPESSTFILSKYFPFTTSPDVIPPSAVVCTAFTVPISCTSPDAVTRER